MSRQNNRYNRPNHSMSYAQTSASLHQQIRDDESEVGEEVDAPEYTLESYSGSHRILLPSGKYIRLRPLSVLSMVRRGELPNALIPQARRALGLDTAPKKAAVNETDDTLELTDYIVCQMVSSFAVVDKRPGECQSEEMSIDFMLDADKVAIFAYAMRGQEALSSFRSQS